jgi:uncharacterized delta-60 repeat protein
VLRVTPAGALHPAYGDGGIALALDDGEHVEVHDLIADAAGRAVVAGYVQGGSGPPSGFVARLTTGGAPDTTFGGGDGLVTVPVHWVEHLDAAPDGALAVVGELNTGEVRLARLTAAGAVDPAFSGDGWLSLTASGSAVGAVARPDGRLAAVFRSGNVLHARQYTAAGGGDPWWGAGGAATVPLTGVVTGSRWEARTVLAEPTGGLSIAGTTCLQNGCNARTFVRRLTASGATDTTWASGGTFLADLHPGTYEQVNDADRRSDGSLVLATVGTVTADDIVDRVARLLPSGQLDDTWGTAGQAQLPATSPVLPTRLAAGPGGVTLVRGAFDVDVHRLEDRTPAGSPGGYAGIAPARALDTRVAGSGPCLSEPEGRALLLRGRSGVPASGAGAVALNVTVTGAGTDGYLTAYANGRARPTASNVNYGAGRTVANTVIARLGNDGHVRLFASGGCPHVVVDVVGWFAAGDAEPGGLTSLPAPRRLLDTRLAGQGPCLSGADGRALTVTGVGGVPASGVGVVALNVAVTGPSLGGVLSAFPNGGPRPTASNLNYARGQTVANTVLARVGTGGQVRLHASGGCPHVVVDVVGWFSAGAPAVVDGGLTGLVPARLLDTRRTGQGPCLAAPGGRAVTVTGVGGVPASGVAAVVLNVTAIAPSTTGYLAVWPNGSARPTASNVNYARGQIIAGTVLAKVGAGGQVRVFGSSGCPHLAVDVVGWVAA